MRRLSFPILNDRAMLRLADTECRLCGNFVSREDIMDGAVFVESSEQFPYSQTVHQRCWLGLKDIWFGENGGVSGDTP